MGLFGPSENFGYKILADACDSRWLELKWFELSEVEDGNFVRSKPSPISQADEFMVCFGPSRHSGHEN